MGILQMNLAAAVAGVGYLVHAGKFPLASYTELLKEPLGVRVAACTAGACSLVLGLRSLEHMAYSGEQTSGTGPLTRTIAMLENLMGQEKNRNIVVKDWINEYNELHKSNDPAQRNSAYAKMVNAYYELATSFYEWGWGSSFHFSYRMRGESFSEATRRHEYALAAHLGLKPGAKVIDVGCGIGGPMRNIARFTGWDITGVTVNEYQVRRGNDMARQEGLVSQCHLEQMDFMDLTFPAESMDGAYAIEATCHAPDRVKVYSQIFRTLKPGAIFATYEWCLTEKWDGSSKHKWIKKAIEEGDALPDMAFTWQVADAMRAAGFELVHERDAALDANQEIVWYRPMCPSWNPLSQRFQFNAVGLLLTTWVLRLLEFVYVVPSGTSQIQVMLQKAGTGCAQGGLTGCFTPMYLMVARKPEAAAKK